VTSRLEAAVGEDLITSHVTWQDIITGCKRRQQELEQEEHRDVTYSIESLSTAVSEVFRQREITKNDDRKTLHTNGTDDVITDDHDIDAQDADTEEYSQILD